MYSLKNLLLALLIVAGNSLYGQQARLTAYQPTREEEMVRYKKAILLDSLVRNTVYKSNVAANWQLGGENFWYRNYLKDSTQEYFYVDAAHGKKQKAFDQQRLATALGKASEQVVNADKLGISKLWFSKNGKDISFEYKGKNWQCNLDDYSCQKIDSLPKDTTHYPHLSDPPSRWDNYATDSISPDKKWAAYIKDGNVFLQPVAGGDAVPFTTDGTTAKPYGQLAWSPDSRYVIGYHINPIKDSSIYYVLSSVPNTTRGQLRSQEYKQPGDPFTTYEMYIFNVAAKTAVKANTEIIDFFEAPLLNWRTTNPDCFYYEKADRGHQRFRIIEINAATAAARTVVDEETKTFIYTNRIFTYYIPGTDDILMSSEKDGWQHLYMVGGITGWEKQKITNGNWVVRSVDSVDLRKKEIWFTASGMNSGEDPYYLHYYRIGFDGKKLLSLTPALANHTVRFSPDKKYYIDTYSQINVPPVTELHRTSDGKLVMELERADISRWVATGVRPAEVFVAKGRDGITDIWGIVCRPRDFDSTKRYPVIENIYAGPQDAFVPKSFMSYSEMMSMAQLGFIVVQMDGMGTANRSKAFHDVCWKNLGDAGFPDRILWMKALAAKYPYVDITRVGVYGTSAGGQNSTGALLFHPEFYKAAVSACGCQDNRIDKQWWNEQWMGYPVGQHYADQSNITNASKLEGDLMLIVGEADMNVPPESTYRLADALIKSGKTFDFLTIPGMGHSDGGPYGRLKKRDFFVKHLLGVDAPDRNKNELK